MECSEGNGSLRTWNLKVLTTQRTLRRKSTQRSPFTGFHRANPLAAELLVLLGLLLALLGGDCGLDITFLGGLGLARLVTSHGEVERGVVVGLAVSVGVRWEGGDGKG